MNLEKITTTKDLLKAAQDALRKAIDNYAKNLAEIHLGKASANLVEEIKVESYGQLMPLKHLATISIPDAHLILIQPWDANNIAPIKKAIASSKLAVTPTDDGKMVRVPIPPLSKERRLEMDRVVKDEAEHARISIRTVRRSLRERIEAMEKDGLISEDEAFKAKEDVQKLVDKAIKEIDAMLHEKEEELKVL